MAAEVDAAPVDGSAASDGRVKDRSSNRDCNDPGVASNSSVDLRSSNLATRRLEDPTITSASASLHLPGVAVR
jgi:hypothetical protein